MVVTRPRLTTSADERRAATIASASRTPAANASAIRAAVDTVSGGSWVEELITELLDGHNRVGKHRHLFAQPPHVHVDRARAAGVGVAPYIRQQQIARQDAAAVLHQILEQQ